MAERFYDDFNRANGALGADWTVKLFNFGNVQIVNQAATNVGTDPAGARVNGYHVQGDEQELSAAFMMSDPTAGDAIYLGLGSDAGTFPMGFAARFQVGDSGGDLTYAVDIIADFAEQITAPSPTIADTEAVTPLLNGAGSMAGVVQNLRIRLRRADGGYELLVWFNQNDDELPTLTWKFLRDHESVLLDPTSENFGRAWFRPHSDTDANRVWVGSIEWRALALTGPRASQWQLPHRPTLAEIRSDVLAVVERRPASPNADHAYVNTRINWAQDEILNELGDQATFMRYRETIELVADGNGVVELPFRIGRLLKLQDDLERDVAFAVLGLTAYGHTQVKLQWLPTGTFTVTYEPMREKMIRDSDRCLIPDQYASVLVWKSAMALLASDTSAAEFQLAEKSYRDAHSAMLMSLRTHQRGSRTVMGVNRLRPTPSQYARWR